MAYYLQIYCSHYGRGGRAIAFAISDGNTLSWDMEDEKKIRDWVDPLNKILESLDIAETLHLFNGDYEVRQISPLLSKKAKTRLNTAVDLYRELKQRTRLSPYPSYSMDALAQRLESSFEITIGEDFYHLTKSTTNAALEKILYGNLRVMKAIGEDLRQLLQKQSNDRIQMDTFQLRPFMVQGTTNDTEERYIQRDDILYEEKNGHFIFEAAPKRYYYDERRVALAIETNAPITSTIKTPPGFIILAIDDVFYYETLLAYIDYIRQSLKV